MNPLTSLAYVLSRHPLPTRQVEADLASGQGMRDLHVYQRDCLHRAALVEAAAMGSRPSVGGHLSTADPTSTAEEVALQVLGVVLRWRAEGRTRDKDGRDDTVSPRSESAWRHAERLIERSVLRRE